MPRAVDVFDIALATATVTVDGQAPYRKGEYFRKEVTVGSGPVWKSLEVTATGETRSHAPNSSLPAQKASSTSSTA